MSRETSKAPTALKFSGLASKKVMSEIHVRGEPRARNRGARSQSNLRQGEAGGDPPECVAQEIDSKPSSRSKEGQESQSVREQQVLLVHPKG